VATVPQQLTALPPRHIDRADPNIQPVNEGTHTKMTHDTHGHDQHSHNSHGHDDHGSHGSQPPQAFDVRILRQDGPGKASYWQRHRVNYERDMNVISVLQRVAANSQTVDGEPVAPVAWDCNCLEEVCGACTMVVNGRVRQACTALVDRLLEENAE